MADEMKRRDEGVAAKVGARAGRVRVVADAHPEEPDERHVVETGERSTAPSDEQAVAAHEPGVPDVGEILRRLRKRRGLSLRQVADLSGLSVSFLRAVERGESDISLGRLARVARIFGHDVGSFLGYS